MSWKKTPVLLGLILLVSCAVASGDVDVEGEEIGSPETAKSNDVISDSSQPPIEIDLIRYPTDTGNDVKESVSGSSKDYASYDDVIAEQNQGGEDVPAQVDNTSGGTIGDAERAGPEKEGGNGEQLSSGTEDENKSVGTDDLYALRNTYEKIINLWQDTLGMLSTTKDDGQNTHEIDEREVAIGQRHDTNAEEKKEEVDDITGVGTQEEDIIDIDGSNQDGEDQPMDIQINTHISKTGHDTDKHPSHHNEKKHHHHHKHSKHHKEKHIEDNNVEQDHIGIDNAHHHHQMQAGDNSMQADRPWYALWGEEETDSTGKPVSKPVDTDIGTGNNGWFDYDDEDDNRVTHIALRPGETPPIETSSSRKPSPGYTMGHMDGFDDNEIGDILYSEDGSAGLTEPGGVQGGGYAPWIDPRLVPDADFHSGAVIKLLDHYQQCDTCMVIFNRTDTQCPFYVDMALEFERLSSEYVQILRYGCGKPGISDRGRCCHNSNGLVQTTISEISQLVRALQRIMSNQCDKCPVDCYWSEWSSWSSCPYTCERGIDYRTRTRKRLGPAGRYGGRDCHGRDLDEEPCPVQPKEYGQWLPWSSWSACSSTCGGVRHRTRKCQEPDTCSICFVPCSGDHVEFADCGDNTRCCRDRQWGPWASWTECVDQDQAIGSPRRLRWRSCEVDTRYPNQPVCATPCPGKDSDYDDCCIKSQWSTWGPWSVCDAPERDKETNQFCGPGCRNRTRECILGNCPNDPGCSGDSIMRTTCQLEPCCVDPVWSEWCEWGACSVSTGVGFRTRRRYCQPDPTQWRNVTCKFRGCYNQGSESETEQCTGECPACPPPTWGSWEAWSDCRATIGGRSEKTRIRRCVLIDQRPECRDTCPPPQSETAVCVICRDPYWGSWGPWSGDCTALSRFMKTRRRSCINPSQNIRECPGTCIGNEQETDQCPCVPPNWNSWTSWGDCDVTRRQRRRTRTCIDVENPPYCPRGQCPGRDDDYEPCCGQQTWESWGPWSGCRYSQRIEERVRFCSPSQPGCPIQCPGPDREERDCPPPSDPPCDPQTWGPWGPWSGCRDSERREERVRVCLPPQRWCPYIQCPGPDREERDCPPPPPPCDDGQWGQWGQWSACNCERKEKTRTRTRVTTSRLPLCRVYPSQTEATYCNECGCVESCRNRADGNWPSSCKKGCTHYIYCCAGTPKLTPCYAGQYYDSECSGCRRGSSPTCPDGVRDIHHASTNIVQRPSSQCPGRRKRAVPRPCKLLGLG